MLLDKRTITESQLQNQLKASFKEEAGEPQFTQSSLHNIQNSPENAILMFEAVRDSTQHVLDFKLIHLNTAASTLLLAGGQASEGRSLTEVMPYAKNEIFDICKEVVTSGTTKKLEQRIKGKGYHRWFDVTIAKLTDGFLITISDITTQKLQQHQSEEREFLLRAAENIANVGSWWWNASTQNMFWSDGLCKIFNRDKVFLPSWQAFIDDAHEDDRDALNECFRQAMAAKEGFEIEYRARVKGQIKYLKLVGRLMSDANGFSDGLMGTVKDISEEKLNELWFKHQSEELRRSNDELEKFAYVASHDLQEPLRKIRAFANRLETKYKNQLEAEALEYIDRMHKAAERMQTLIQDIFAFSRVSRVADPFLPADLNTVLANVLDDLEAYIEHKHAQITIGKLPVIIGDKVQLKRLFQNLLSNAIKFHQPGENPVITVSSSIIDTEQAAAEFGIPLQELNYHRISIKDNGIGFDQQYADKIFNIFQRLHGRVQYEGSGIGLAICRRIVTNHSGYITARSQENQGAEFLIIFPFRK